MTIQPRSFGAMGMLLDFVRPPASSWLYADPDLVDRNAQESPRFHKADRPSSTR